MVSIIYYFQFLFYMYCSLRLYFFVILLFKISSEKIRKSNQVCSPRCLVFWTEHNVSEGGHVSICSSKVGGVT
jgi:hypothetical protein